MQKEADSIDEQLELLVWDNWKLVKRLKKTATQLRENVTNSTMEDVENEIDFERPGLSYETKTMSKSKGWKMNVSYDTDRLDEQPDTSKKRIGKLLCKFGETEDVTFTARITVKLPHALIWDLDQSESCEFIQNKAERHWNHGEDRFDSSSMKRTDIVRSDVKVEIDEADADLEKARTDFAEEILDTVNRYSQIFTWWAEKLEEDYGVEGTESERKEAQPA